MLKTFSMTDIGRKRKLNQDYVFTSREPVGMLPNLFIVADGMGGHNAGDYASKYTTETIVEEIRSSGEKDPVEAVRAAIGVANHRIRETAMSREELRGMGTTLVVATIIGDYLYVANVGDSRLYIVNDEINQITKDHSLVEEMVRMGQIDRGDARNHPDKNVITRAIGAEETVRADFFEIRLRPGDIVLMCSDGLTNMIEDEDIRRIMSGQGDVAAKAGKLIGTANSNGGRDNIAVIVMEPFADEVKE